MCLAIPGRLVERINEERGLVDLGGVKKEIALNFIPDVEIGQWMLIHTGFGLEIISEEDALETIYLLRQAYGLSEDGS